MFRANKHSVAALLLLVACAMYGQYNSNFMNHSYTGRSVSTSLDFEAGSTGMSSKMVDKLVFGGYISKELKDESSKNLRGVNYFGIALNYNMGAFIKGGKNYDFLISAGNQEILNARYTKDVFNLMFYGNQMYKGQTANLSNCNINALRFQEVKFGAMLKNIDSVGKIGVSVSFLKGEQLFYINTLKNSGLYTSPDGGELVFNSDFSMALSDTSNKRLTGFNGVGASADIYFETSYKSHVGKRSVLIVNANNIGFIHWLNNSVQYSSDSMLRFSGYQINNINDLKDSAISRINRDSLLHNLAHARKENFNVNIPTNLIIINRIFFGAQQRYCFSFGFRHIFNANYVPYVFIEPELKWKQLTFNLHTGYGGYVRLNVGASMMWNGKGWFVKLGSNSLQGYILPTTAYGQGLFFSVAKKLK